MTKPKRFLIVKLSSMGDIIHALPVASALKSKFPDSFVGWAVEESFRDILSSAPFIDRVYFLNTKKWRRDIISFNTIGEITHAIKEIRNEDFDITIDAQGLIKSGVIAYLSGAPARIGFSERQAREPLSAIFYNRRITPSRDIVHIIDQNLYLIRELVGETESIEHGLCISENNESWAMKEMRMMGIPNGDLKVLISPCAGWKTKIWNPDKYKKLITELNDRYQARVILSGGFQDKGFIEMIASGLQITIPKLIGYSISQMMGFLKVVNLVIGGDTGPVHVASALGTPTLSLYGPSSAKRSAPRGDVHKSVQSGLKCSPCFGRKCRLEGFGRADAIVPCMGSISLETIKVKLEEILDKVSSYSYGGYLSEKG